MSGLGTVYRKEVRENLRDRRSLFNSVLLGPILFPILFIGMAYFVGSKQQERAEQVLEIEATGIWLCRGRLVKTACSTTGLLAVYRVRAFSATWAMAPRARPISSN